ncbi:hypothetical protein KUTeg_008370 [Tegillarca granosa]|uniref:G-protein coupled receptors family 2 profile 2 domain-containing protein n=1 Tax=Tegillarca granosa TaxID=220873 RepID=A0ABQ9F8Z5_TEGGR|nr:hypothetical protein KUTeg_008370 [Tegillarca granosa]
MGTTWEIFSKTKYPSRYGQNTNYSNDDFLWACKVETVFLNYAMVTNFFWMLVEGLYLHIIIVWTYSSDKIKLWYFIIIGWESLR